VPKAAPADKAPLAFIWNSRYFQQVAPANPSFDATDQAAVRERAVRSTIKYLMDEEHMDDFGVTNVTIRPVSIATDADLLNVNPGARWAGRGSRRDRQRHQQVVSRCTQYRRAYVR